MLITKESVTAVRASQCHTVKLPEGRECLVRKMNYKEHKLWMALLNEHPNDNLLMAAVTVMLCADSKAGERMFPITPEDDAGKRLEEVAEWDTEDIIAVANGYWEIWAPKSDEEVKAQAKNSEEADQKQPESSSGSVSVESLDVPTPTT